MMMKYFGNVLNGRESKVKSKYLYLVTLEMERMVALEFRILCDLLFENDLKCLSS